MTAEAMTLENLTKAVELHRPETSDKYGHHTDDPDKVVHRRCTQCLCSVTEQGCTTWKTANGGS